jgi:RNA-binding protein YlmH
MHLYALFAALLTGSIAVSSTLAFTVLSPALSLQARRSLHRCDDHARYPHSATTGTTTLLRFSVDDIESKAQSASEAWDFHVTPFLSAQEAGLVQERLQNRADVACFRVGGRVASARARFVFTNPELGLEAAAMEAEYCVVLAVKNAKAGQDPWPNMLAAIGVDKENVGDVVDAEGVIYMAVTPEVAKQCQRLLPKQVVGAGVSVKPLEPDEAMPEDGELQDMDVQRLDKRAQYSAQKNK